VTELDTTRIPTTWRSLAKERGLECAPSGCTRGCCLDEEDLARKLTPGRAVGGRGGFQRARYINDVAQLVKQAHAVGALAFVTGALRQPPDADVRAWNCDFSSAPPTKFYGPHVGVLWGRRELLEKTGCTASRTRARAAPERLETGDSEPRRHRGGAAAVDFSPPSRRLHAPRRERLGARAQRLQQRGADCAGDGEGLRAIPEFELYVCRPAGTARPRCPSRSPARCDRRWPPPFGSRHISCRTAISTRAPWCGCWS